MFWHCEGRSGEVGVPDNPSIGYETKNRNVTNRNSLYSFVFLSRGDSRIARFFYSVILNEVKNLSFRHSELLTVRRTHWVFFLSRPTMRFLVFFSKTRNDKGQSDEPHSETNKKRETKKDFGGSPFFVFITRQIREWKNSVLRYREAQ